MHCIDIDIETYSDVDLGSTNVYRYVESPKFEILLFSYSIDEGPVKCVDLTQNERIPQEVLDALTDPSIEKWAFNAAFERVCLSKYLGMPLGTYIDPNGWHCALVGCRANGVPGSLAAAGEFLKIDKQKIESGKDLIKVFCCPQAYPKTKKAQATWKERIMPEDRPEEWEEFKVYNIRDVEAEMEIERKVGKKAMLKAFDYAGYVINERINDQGIGLDMDYTKVASDTVEMYDSIVVAKAQELLDNDEPFKKAVFEPWLAERGIVQEKFDKDTINDILEKGQFDNGVPVTDEVGLFLRLKQEHSKTSLKKYRVMLDLVNSDGRVRGAFIYQGASTTGRFSSKGVQLHNLKKNKDPNLRVIRKNFKERGHQGLKDYIQKNIVGEDRDFAESKYLAELIRPAFIPKKGCLFADVDFSAIEARVLPWLAGDEGTLDIFRAGRDIYCETASNMYGVHVEKNGENGHLRAMGKVATLACGYNGGANAVKNFAPDMTEDERKDIVTKWRAANPIITKYWTRVETTARKCLSMPDTWLDDVWVPDEDTGEIYQSQNCVPRCKMYYSSKKNFLAIKLPSGRNLIYANFHEREVIKFGKLRPELCYEGSPANEKSKSVKFVTVGTYGGKLTENITQAVARDILIYSLLNLNKAGYLPVVHVHDEVLVEVNYETAEKDLERISEIMATPPSWAEGLPLKADGYLCECFLKDPAPESVENLVKMHKEDIIGEKDVQDAPITGADIAEVLAEATTENIETSGTVDCNLYEIL